MYLHIYINPVINKRLRGRGPRGRRRPNPPTTALSVYPYPEGNDP